MATAAEIKEAIQEKQRITQQEQLGRYQTALEVQIRLAKARYDFVEIAPFDVFYAVATLQRLVIDLSEKLGVPSGVGETEETKLASYMTPLPTGEIIVTDPTQREMLLSSYNYSRLYIGWLRRLKDIGNINSVWFENQLRDSTVSLIKYQTELYGSGIGEQTSIDKK